MGKRSRNSSENSYSSSDDEYIGSDNLSSEKFDEVGESSIGGDEFKNASRRRGRGPSKRPCLNKNALMARQNRQKKKEYLEKIENQLRQSRRENKTQFGLIQRQIIDLKRLSAENSYLRSVLKNGTKITTLLTSMNEILGRSQSHNLADNCYNKMADISEQKTPDQRTLQLSDPWMADFHINNEAKTTEHQRTQNSIQSKEFDHTYSSDSRCDNEYDCEESSACHTASTPINENCESPSDFGISDSALNKFDLIDNDLFDNIFHETNNGNLYTENFKPENLFESLDDTGVCFHVNSGKISMEFCTVCHLNSIHAEDPSLMSST